MSLGAIPGTGPNTSPLPVIRKSKVKTLADLPTGRTLVMGILNVTEDSFSDGGAYLSADAAIDRGLKLLYSGADIIDVGGESTRPGAKEIDPALEQSRIIPVIETLVKAGAIVSVDTMHVDTARAAINAGAHIINDVSGLTYEAGMPELIAQTGVPYVLMHRRGTAQSMVAEANYENVVAEVIGELRTLRDEFVAKGVAPEQIIIDPGLGFAKDAEHNWALLGRLDALEELGHRVLIGTSRKRFLGELLAESGTSRAPLQRDAATAATTALAARDQAWAVRVHDVVGSRDAIEVVKAYGSH
ncbi:MULTISPECIES: dihydropteroate synthase [Glutamicibacter]|uniref:Dihydropteroate synthase n=1 Tax=Glutamicibacter halophytocola TaxID=1933880 RepID=A0A5B8I484_9MICC|nr:MULTISPECIES: dihydropteroate synthase [Glutamicibacter]ALG27625.1 dihydropteroate synthase [Glutamicibacter halophytocola]MBF6673677.1 dihydropteroate synthase [Glutamicibacter sp. FBE19]NQD41731.1 dihydropteroate synthase [Glutamicibacter halophytocola]QDY67006.1 dihydropteroate synthase [Glutamicibacter halophytocola]UUX59158.1 dihydropteroate synthase [Glutamicibacter halophytocola]